MLLGFSGCFKDEYGYLQNYKAKTAEAEKAFLNNDYPKAEECYLSATKSAEEMGWVIGIATVKRDLAKLHSSYKKYDKAETTFNEAREICKKDQECYADDVLGSIYDNLMFFYLHDIKDITKAEQLVDEVISQHPKDKSIKIRLLDYADSMRNFGFEKQSKALRNRINYL
jgi:tetratricopeptide (TPR) repeat protein